MGCCAARRDGQNRRADADSPHSTCPETAVIPDGGPLNLAETRELARTGIGAPAARRAPGRATTYPRGGFAPETGGDHGSLGDQGLATGSAVAAPDRRVRAVRTAG